MIQIEYDPVLIEQATFLAARCDPQRERDLHKVIDPLYEIPDDESRQRAFEAAFAPFFRAFGLDAVIEGLIAERPIISERVDRCIVHEASRAKAESAELFVGQPEHGSGRAWRTLVIQACPHSLHDSGALRIRLRRELLHVSDMLDDRFGYRPESLAGASSRENLERDRYRVLWDFCVEARLQREGRGDECVAAGLERAFRRVFPQAGEGAGIHRLGELANGSALTHDDLLGWAREPDRVFDGGDGPVADREEIVEPHPARAGWPNDAGCRRRASTAAPGLIAPPDSLPASGRLEHRT
jgi:hypothetical protein